MITVNKTPIWIQNANQGEQCAMRLDEILESYDEIDREYRARFNDAKTVTGKTCKKDMFSFIPNPDEVMKILFEPLKLVN